MDRSINSPNQGANQTVEWVWYDGVDAILEGTGVCYHWDYESPVSPANTSGDTTATADARRTNRVLKPNATNGKWFAGVCLADHPASPTGSLIEIAVPGSTCKVLTKANLTIGVGSVTCQCGGAYAGYFTAKGLDGAGTAVPLQTLDTSSTPGKTLCRLQEGEQSGLVEVLAPADAAQSFVVLPAVTITAAAGTTTAGGARQSMVGGVTHYATATNGAAITTTLADGTRIGEKKSFAVDGTQTTNGVTVTVTTGKKADDSTSITTLISSTAGTICSLVWGGKYWKLQSAGGWTVT